MYELCSPDNNKNTPLYRISSHCLLYLTLIGNKVDRPKSTRSSEVGPANRTKRIESGIKSRPKLKRGQTSADDEWFSTESTLSESETKTVSTPSHQEESDSTCKTQCPRTDLSKRFLPKQMTTTG